MADVDPLRPAPGADPFLFDAERLQALASEAVVRRGVAYFNEHRVVSLGWDEARLWAEVQGSQPELAYQVDVALDEDREPLACCTCPFDLEPACKHVVAALMAYAAQIDLAEVENAAEQAIAERQRRARTEVVVQHLAGELTFGTWAARSVSDAGASLRPYRVHLRSTTERINACSCPDFAGNRLGTCKHIEAVLHRLAKRHIDAHEPALPVVYLAWPGASDDGAPAIAVRRPRSVAPEVAALLERHFDPRGTLRGALPEAWDAVEQDLGQRDDVHLGDDARAHALRVATDLAHARRGDAIRDAITRSGGHLPGVRARLYPYQTEGVAMLASAGRALLADDMGLGKTLQAIAAARWLFDHAGVARVLVVCPASLKAQWAREVRRFTGLDAVVVEGGAAPRLAQYRQHAPFTIVNYEIVVRDQSAIAAALGPDLLVLDEAQRIKNWRTKTAAAIKAIETRYAFVLSGTPLENRLEDLYSVMQVVDARVLGPLWQFMRRFHVSDERGKVVAYRNLSELRRRLAPVMLRRDKRVVRDQLPERVVQTIPVPLSERQSELHAGALLVAGRYAQVMKRRPLTPIEEKKLLAALQSARMACDAAGLVDHETVGSPKLDELARILEAACVDGGEKVVVFSQWELMTRMAEDVAKGLGLGVARLHGGVPSRARGELVERFREDPDVQVFIATDAGSTGLNLQCASVLVNLDMPWNPAVLEQRIGRVHRLGQPSSVHAFLLVAADSYEERVASLVREKADLFGAVVEPDATSDVVALGRRTLEAAVDAIGEAPPARADADATEAQSDSGERGDGGEVGLAELATDLALAAPGGSDTAGGPAGAAHGGTTSASSDDVAAELAPALRDAIAATQAAFGGRVEEMIASGTGLVVILDRADAASVETAATLSTELDIAVVDRRTWQALTRMGTLGPTRPVPAPIVVAVEPALFGLARRQLAAAEALLERALAGPALGLLAEAMLARTAAVAGRDAPPASHDAAAWLFVEAIPKGFAPAEVAHAILCAQSLAHAPTVPDAVVADVAARARSFVAA